MKKTAQTKSKLAPWQLIITIGTIIVAIVCAIAVFTRQPIIEKITLQHSEDGFSEMSKLDKESYQQLIDEKKSFLILTHQPGCTAKILSFISDYAAENQFDYYYFLWSDLRETSLKDFVKYAPSVILIREGKPVAALNSNSNDDTKYYNDYAEFSAWLGARLELE